MTFIIRMDLKMHESAPGLCIAEPALFYTMQLFFSPHCAELLSKLDHSAHSIKCPGVFRNPGRSYFAAFFGFLTRIFWIALYPSGVRPYLSALK